MKRQIVTTSDGSHSLYVPELDEHYHSTHGAVQEARHVFIAMGLDYFPADQDLRLLEVGLGTGLNLWLTLMASAQRKGKIHYHGIEAFPLTLEEAQALNYPEVLQQPREIFLQLHATAWETPVDLAPQLELLKQKALLQDVEFTQTYDIVYFDAFAPNRQPEMWKMAMLQKMCEALKPGGVWVTYCAKGQLRRDLKALGLQVERLPGPPGKREMIRATK
ncbi:MAG: tRNA (5-methylaminomethyl-2-thiouridine)(34)-methyltransferase MnmD [Salibacteraceae bacterium]